MKTTDANAGNEIIFELQDRIDEAIEVLKDTSVDMDSILLCETIGYAIHILEGKE